jgi:hypothetical protein
MKAGRPTTYIPSPSTVARDIKTLFEKSRQRIDKILKVPLVFPLTHYEVTYLWHRNIQAIFTLLRTLTSPNHRAFVAWTVHLHHEGHILTFLLDVIEVPESHTGDALARAFHKMLVEHGLTQKVRNIMMLMFSG